jgi:hypothetical protein
MPKKEYTARPYLRRSSIYAEVAKLFKLYGEILGEISNAIADLLPGLYQENKDQAIFDCTYPTPAMQCGEGKNFTEEYKSWYCNQVIARVMGRDLGNMKASNMPVAMHYDSGDEPITQLLVYSPCDNHVHNTDLLIFERKDGGPCYRVKTSIKKTMTILLMNSAEQLHANAIEERCDLKLPYSSYSIRFIHYVHSQTKKFEKERKDDAIRPWLSVIPPDNHTKALKFSELENGMLVSTKYYTDKNREYLQARVTKRPEGKFDLTWLIDGLKTKDWKRKVYHHECTDTNKKCKRCWTLPTGC